MGIAARKQLQHELVQVEAAEQGPASQDTDGALGVRPGEGGKLSPSAPRQEQEPERKEQPAEPGAGPTHAARHQPHPAVLGQCERLHDEARLAPRARVQHVARRVLDATGQRGSPVMAEAPEELLVVRPARPAP